MRGKRCSPSTPGVKGEGEVGPVGALLRVWVVELSRALLALTEEGSQQTSRSTPKTFSRSERREYSMMAGQTFGRRVFLRGTFFTALGAVLGALMTSSCQQ